MVQYKILIQGYAKQIKNGWKASSTTTLIKDSGKSILVDPGCNRKLLLQKLKEERLTPNDIDMVFLTHYHLDHALLAGIFEKAEVLDGTTIYKEDREGEYSKIIPGTNIQILLTPGHSLEHSSLVFKTEKGKIAVAADLFCWMENEKQATNNINVLINREDPFVQDMKALKTSRKKVLDFANWIIPGHGKMFRNKK